MNSRHKYAIVIGLATSIFAPLLSWLTLKDDPSFATFPWLIVSIGVGVFLMISVPLIIIHVLNQADKDKEIDEMLEIYKKEKQGK